MTACGPSDLVGHRLAEVVQQRGPPGGLLTGSQLGGHDRGQMRALDRVLEHVLAVRGAVVQPAEHLDQLGMQAVHVGLERCLLARLDHLLLDLGLGLEVHLLDPGGMDAAVGDQALDGQPGDLTADAVEGRQHHRLGRVVDDDVDAGEVLERADVAALATDDAALRGRRREAAPPTPWSRRCAPRRCAGSRPTGCSGRGGRLPAWPPPRPPAPAWPSAFGWSPRCVPAAGRGPGRRSCSTPARALPARRRGRS